MAATEYDDISTVLYCTGVSLARSDVVEHIFYFLFLLEFRHHRCPGKIKLNSKDNHWHTVSSIQHYYSNLNRPRFCSCCSSFKAWIEHSGIDNDKLDKL
jgi:hypothetical protein